MNTKEILASSSQAAEIAIIQLAKSDAECQAKIEKIFKEIAEHSIEIAGYKGIFLSNEEVSALKAREGVK